ncbi:MAG TPA: twin-arginine translocase TatA/TatE family subunit [Solirubrobacteraceae bacterium]|nr:twin-arginine translocase TatA/TatE family subunit [Solirubrobacteraceae bacterium]
MPGIGIPELIIVLVILLVIFGPKRLPGLGRSLGSGMREFKDSISGRTKADDEDEDDDEPRQLEPPAAVSSEHRAADERVTEPRA